jgi:hypothetical protein
MSAARGAALAPADAARLVASLRTFTPAEVGCAAWWQQRRALERLNAGAHAEAAAAAAVFTALCASAPGAVDVLARELLLAEAWRDRVVPRLGALRRALCASSL